MRENSENQIALFVHDERTGQHAFNAQGLKALGIDPAEARDRGYPLKDELKQPLLTLALVVMSLRVRLGPDSYPKVDAAKKKELLAARAALVRRT